LGKVKNGQERGEILREKKLEGEFWDGEFKRGILKEFGVKKVNGEISECENFKRNNSEWKILKEKN
jgi:hypothetical protein